MRVIAVILIIVGLIIAAYPLADKAYTLYLEYKFMEEYIVSLTQDDVSSDTSDDFGQLQQVFEEELDESIEDTAPPINNVSPTPSLQETNDSIKQESPSPTKKPKKKSYSKFKTIGRIEIPKIDVNIPILEGTSKANLKVGAGHLTGTSELGSIGNAALAAHRSHTYGRMFNRLDEVEIGDKIKITTNDDSFEYTVYEILVVEPNDISVLYRSREDSVLTLITCTPLYTATHRLIVHAVIR